MFASKEISGSDGSLLTQLWRVGTTLIYGFTVSFIILKVIDMTMGLRVTEDQEREGLDISLWRAHRVIPQRIIRDIGTRTSSSAWNIFGSSALP